MVAGLWQKRKLGELCSIRIGGTPARNAPVYWDSTNTSDNLWVSIRDLNKRVVDDTLEKITDAGVRNSNAKLVKKGSVLMSFKLTIGRVAFAGKDLYTNEAIAAFDSEEVDLDFLYYGLQHWDLLGDADQAIKGVTLNKEKIRRIEAYLPVSRVEQSKIAEVLATVDRAIEQTEALIAKYQRIKTGLMHDLLTRGIDENGKLRDPTTHRFKASLLGLIPEEWELVTLGQVVTQSRGIIQTGPFGSQLHAHEYTTEGVSVIMPQDVVDNGWISGKKLVRIPQRKAAELQRHSLRLNDVVFARRGDLSRCAVITEREANWICGTDFMLVRLAQTEINGFWLAAVYRHYFCQRQVLARAVGSTMLGINTALLSNLVIPKPPLSEQNRVVKVIQSFDLLIETEIKSQFKLRAVKQGLMQDLLTGQVSVAPLLDISIEALS